MDMSSPSSTTTLLASPATDMRRKGRMKNSTSKAFNRQRPQTALGHMTPVEYVATFTP